MLISLLFGGLGLRIWFLSPVALMLALLTGEFYLPLALGLGYSIHGHWRGERFEIHHRSVLALLALGLAISALSWSSEGWGSAGWILLPWVWWMPLRRWMSSNSGGGAVYVPFFALTLVLIFSGGEDVLALSMFSYFFILVAWYRQLPQSILLLSLGLGVLALGALGLEMWQAMILCVAVMFFQMGDKWLWGRGGCLLRYWALASLALGAFSLWMAEQGLGLRPGLGWMPLLMLMALLWMAEQEVCRLCLSTARCREMVVSFMGARAPLLAMLLAPLCEFGPLGLLGLMLMVMMAEAMRQTKLRPVVADQILESPCRGLWADLLLRDAGGRSL